MSTEFLSKIGKSFLKKLDYFGGVCGLFVYAIWETLAGSRKGRKIIRQIIKNQILFTGYNALPIISIISLLLGIVIIVQSVTQLIQIGAENLIGQILIITMVRELGPILTAIIITGRSGTAIATEIGNMMVSHEVEALEAMGIDTLKYIMFPRLIGSIISTICLTIYFATVGIIGGFFVASFQLNIPLHRFFAFLFSAMTMTDLIVSILKSSVFGAIIATISVYHGFKIRLSSTEVPMATTRAVVNSLIYVFTFNGIITILFYI
ncbi:MAG: ABC transporter permease [Spirochaetes bacterium]|nr:ABC transporter permease [Spirochaetota bacterium]